MEIWKSSDIIKLHQNFTCDTDTYQPGFRIKAACSFRIKARCTHCSCRSWVWTAASEWTAGLHSSPPAAGPAPSPCLRLWESALFKPRLPAASSEPHAERWRHGPASGEPPLPPTDAQLTARKHSQIQSVVRFPLSRRDGKTPLLLNFLLRLFFFQALFGGDVISSRGVEAGGAPAGGGGGGGGGGDVVPTERNEKTRSVCFIREAETTAALLSAAEWDNQTCNRSSISPQLQIKHLIDQSRQSSATIIILSRSPYVDVKYNTVM